MAKWKYCWLEMDLWFNWSSDDLCSLLMEIKRIHYMQIIARFFLSFGHTSEVGAPTRMILQHSGVIFSRNFCAHAGKIWDAVWLSSASWYRGSWLCLQLGFEMPWVLWCVDQIKLSSHQSIQNIQQISGKRQLFTYWVALGHCTRHAMFMP